MLDTESRAISSMEGQMSMSGKQNNRLSLQVGGVSEFAPSKLPFAGGSASGNSQESQLEPTECVAPSSIGKVMSKKKVREAESRPLSKNVAQMSLADQHSKGLSVDAGVNDFAPSKMFLPGGSESGSIQQWLLDENFGSTDLLDQNYSYLNVSSKAGSDKRGDSECSPFLREAEVELDGDEYLSQVPESAWAVPESALTASGVNWPKNSYPHQGRLHQLLFLMSANRVAAASSAVSNAKFWSPTGWQPIQFHSIGSPAINTTVISSGCFGFISILSCVTLRRPSKSR